MRYLIVVLVALSACPFVGCKKDDDDGPPPTVAPAPVGTPPPTQPARR